MRPGKPTTKAVYIEDNDENADWIKAARQGRSWQETRETMDKSKTCTTCERSLPLSDFYRDKRRADGRYSECKSCTKARRRLQDAEKRRKAANARRAADPARAREADAAYYQAHRAERNEAQRRYRAKKRGQRDGT